MEFDNEVMAPVLETLTAGIYSGNVTCIREYVQNAVDSGTKRIEINKQNGNDVVIRDYGLGMDEDELHNAVLLGKSNKPDDAESNVGWRGIGIYSAISNFRKIFINTKKKGQDKKLHLEIDCEKLSLLVRTQSPLSQAQRQCISAIEYNDDPEFQPGTEVILSGVLPFQAPYFQDNKIKDYLISNVPLPMKPSGLTKQILNALQERGIKEPEYKLFFNGEELYRYPYDESLFLDGSLAIKDFEVDNKKLATAWLVLSRENKELQGPVRGLIFKKKGFTVGDANTVRRLHPGAYNFWSYGEIHILDPEIRENAGRDNFEISDAAEKLFELLRNFLQKLQQLHRYKSSYDKHDLIEKTKEDIEDKRDYAKAAEQLKKINKSISSRTAKPPEDSSLSNIVSLIDNISKEQNQELSEIEGKVKKVREDQSENRIDEMLSHLPPTASYEIRKKLSNKEYELFHHPMTQLLSSIKKKALVNDTEPRGLLRKVFASNFSDSENDIKQNAKLFLIRPERLKKYSSGNNKYKEYSYFITGGIGHTIYEFYNLFVNGNKHYKGGVLEAILENESKETKAKAYAEMYSIIEFLQLLVKLSDKNENKN
jgi:hypothetical protein